MPALNFQPRFVGAIERGEKRQSIRATWRDGRFPYRPGQDLHLYTGLRTLAARKIGQGVIDSVEAVHITDSGVQVAGVAVADLEAFARSDGFPDWATMRLWWRGTHDLPFDGWIVRWKVGN